MLTACLVVKNGKASVLRCLDAVRQAADEIVVVDTGSDDGTCELVGAWCSANRGIRVIREAVGTRFHDEYGNFDFGAAKGYAVSLATSEYVMWVDVNDILQEPRKVRAFVSDTLRKKPHAGIAMFTRVSRKFRFPRLRVVPREYARFVGNIHECIVNDAPDAEVVETQFEFHNFKSSRDVARNLRMLARDWAERHEFRTAYYIANSYKDMGNQRLAMRWYRIAVDEFPDVHIEDRYKALESLCQFFLHAKDMEHLGVCALEMIQECSDRAEGYYYRAAYSTGIERHSMAVKNLEQVLKCIARPRKTRLWLDPDIYDDVRVEKYLRLAQDRAKTENMGIMYPEEVHDYNGFGPLGL